MDLGPDHESREHGLCLRRCARSAFAGRERACTDESRTFCNALPLLGVQPQCQRRDETHASERSRPRSEYIELRGHHAGSSDGTGLWTNSQASPNEVAVYTPKGKPEKSWLPKVESVETTLSVGSTGNTISGSNFNGFSQGASYGDDAQMSTNYPLVRISNNGTGDVFFARSYNFSTMGVWTTGTTNAEFDIPSSCETGASKLQVIVNGLASTAVSVTLN